MAPDGTARVEVHTSFYCDFKAGMGRFVETGGLAASVVRVKTSARSRGAGVRSSRSHGRERLSGYRIDDTAARWVADSRVEGHFSVLVRTRVLGPRPVSGWRSSYLLIDLGSLAPAGSQKPFRPPRC
jgi:hypothetical protein